MAISDLQMQHVKESMRATWMSGDFGVVAKTIASDAEAFARRLAIPNGARVLDVATGTGNLAIPLARSGAIITGVDIAPNLVAQARERAAAENLTVSFDEGDAEELPYADGAFDAVVSMFGAMFAPRPALVVAEFARVLRPGGLLAMANWNPASFSGQMFAVSARHAPPAPGIEPPVLWGDAKTVTERLRNQFTKIETRIIPIVFDLPASAAGVVAFFRKYFGPTQAAFNRLDAQGQARLTADLEGLWSNANVAADPAEHVLIHNEYLQVTAIRV